jgi:hypothetical protein
MAALDIEAQTALICEAPVSRRSELIELAPEPERLIPALPPAELCFTAKAVGLHDAGWLMEHATTEQIAVCLDLDTWQDFVPDRSKLDEWLEAFADSGDETLLRSTRAMDMELLVLHMKSRISVLLRTLFQNDYWVYFRLLQGVIWELVPETEESALRWRTGRLQDLGFPSWEESMRIYGFIRPEARSELPERERYREVGEWPLPIWMPNLPVQSNAEQSIFRAIAELPPGRCRDDTAGHRESGRGDEPRPRLLVSRECNRSAGGATADHLRAPVQGRAQHDRERIGPAPGVGT